MKFLTILWHFPELLPMLSVTYHAGTSVIVSGGSRNATVNDPKPKWNAQVSKVKNGRKYAANDKVLCHFSLDTSLTYSKIPDSCQILFTFPGFPDKWSPCFSVHCWLLSIKLTVNNSATRSLVPSQLMLIHITKWNIICLINSNIQCGPKNYGIHVPHVHHYKKCCQTAGCCLLLN